MLELPESLASGDVARLFPVIAETGKEQRAASIFLSVLSAVPPYAGAILSQFGQRIGSRSKVDTYTEIVFKNETDATKRDRPDGLIRVTANRNVKWSCLIETKIGKNCLEPEQLGRYLKLARDNNVDAILTISNEFAPIPSHHPLASSIKKSRKVDVFHLSWSSLLTEAMTLHEQALINDPEQAFLIREFVRFFSHPSAGVNGITSMPPEWSTAIERIQAGGNISKADSNKIVGVWHQKAKDLSLQMSQIIGCRVEVVISRKHAADPATRLSEEVDQLCSKSILHSDFKVPNAASAIEITADLTSRLIRANMRIDAPRDKAKSSSRVTWLLRQLKGKDTGDIYVGVVWASRATTTVLSLIELEKNPNLVNDINQNSEIRAFDVTLTTNNSRRFSGIRTFVEELEKLAPKFYEDVGQYLVNWQPPPPKPKHSIKVEVKDDMEKSTKAAGESDALEGRAETERNAGNDHTALLEIPAFLKRLD